MHATKPSAIESLEPKNVWQFFAGLNAIPRCSKKEQQIRAYVLKLAASLKLAAREDRVGNIVIEAPATQGFEKAAPIVLQGHLDMVCEKNAGVTHDFDRDGIKMQILKSPDGKTIVKAEGTTLGADNGIGVALALAAATDPTAKHGPLEILCTIDEEAGMTGAKAVEPGFFKGQIMLNLDSEEDDALYIGCAGGTDTTLSWTLPRTAPAAGDQVFTLRVTGLKGGHSGCDIHLNRGSAIALLGQVLREVNEPALRLATISGGSKRNALPREASAVIGMPSAAAARLKKIVEATQAEAVANGEADCRISLEPASATPMLSTQDTRRILTALLALPHGVLAVVPEIPGLVQSSNGTTTITSTENGPNLRIDIGCLSRSSSESDMRNMLRKIAAAGELAGASIERANEYPGWAPNVNSPALKTCRQVYEQVFGHAPKVLSIHAGLECGIIGGRVEGMDMISFGPNIRGAHSPDEQVEVESVARMYRYLLAVLEKMGK